MRGLSITHQPHTLNQFLTIQVQHTHTHTHLHKPHSVLN
ncbi:hypothetical protein cypCar_00004475 [Cyprinus carpio]|nr:hypothetical protein cypCar_00004475 [Cyprinus carpio]